MPLRRAHNFVDLTGKQFGLLTVESYVGTKRGYAVWRCHCDGDKAFQCKRVAVVTGQLLRCGKTKSCGCLIRKTNSLRSLDVTGQQFGILEAKEHVASGRMWRFACHGDLNYGCEGTVVASLGNVISGNTTSCGCLHRQKAGDQRRIIKAGLRRGHLEAVEQVAREGSKPTWKFRCHAGFEGCRKFVTAKVSYVLSGERTSCGCAARQATVERNQGNARRLRVGGKWLLVSEMARLANVRIGTIYKRLKCLSPEDAVTAVSRRGKRKA